MDVRPAYRRPASRGNARVRATLASLLAASGLAVPIITAARAGSAPRTITAYVGVASGTSLGYRVPVGGAWSRASELDAPDAGSGAFPVLVDLDGNGVRDLLVGNSDGMVVAFRNTGTDDAPAWVRVTQWEPAIDVGSGAAPAAIDLDGDGVKDLLIGNASGNVIAFRNTGTKQGAQVVTRDRLGSSRPRQLRAPGGRRSEPRRHH